MSPSLPELFSLSSKTAIVTGGTGGLGLAMSIALAEVGADIISIQLPHDPNAEALIGAVTALGRSISVFEGDVGNSDSLRCTFSKIWESGVVPDILLNCAGIVRRGKAEELRDDDIDAVSPFSILFSPNLIPGDTGLQCQSQRLIHSCARIWEGTAAPRQARKNHQYCLNYGLCSDGKLLSLCNYQGRCGADDQGV